VIALEQVRAVGSGAGPEGTRPADESEAVVAAQEEIIGNVKLARAGIFGADAEANILKPAVLDGQPDRSQDLLLSGKDGNVGVAESDAFDDVPGRGHDIDQAGVAGAV